MGFLKSSSESQLDPEYVKTQREDVIKSYVDRVACLKEEVDALENKKQGLELEVKEKFKSEHQKIKTRLENVKLEEKQIGIKRADLLAHTKEFQKEKEAALQQMAKDVKKNEEALQKLMSERRSIENERAVLKAREAAVGKELAEIDENKRKIEERGTELSAKEKYLREERSVIDGILKSQAVREARIEALLSDNEELLRQISEKEAVLRISMDQNREILEAIKLSRATLQGESDNLLSIKEQNSEIALNIKIDRQRLTELERKLKIQQQAIDHDFAKRKTDLDEREKRVLALETKLGG